MREDDSVDLPGACGGHSWVDANDSQFPFSDIGENHAAVSDALQLCPPSYFAPMNGAADTPSQLLFADAEHNHYWQTDQLTSIPPTASPLLDFSSVSAASPSLYSMLSGWPTMQSCPLSPQNPNLPDTSPHCTCLSYLYLCLSHLSSLSPSPISQHTLCSLFVAAKTARDVIRCDICPKRFATGMQNVMLLGTLLTVIADSWLRVSQWNAEELGKLTAPPAYVASLMESLNPAESWNAWLRQTVRNAVIGGPVDQAGRAQCSDSPDLLSLIEEVEARQRKWHSDAASQSRGQPQMLQNAQPGDTPFGDDERFSYLGNPGSGGQPWDERDFLCLRVVGSARKAISRFGFESYENSDGLGS